MSNQFLNDMQQKIVNHTEGAVLVLAGAGSGKTSVLTHRIAHILNQSLAFPSEILAITFTNKAAGEMRSRLEYLCKDAGFIWAQTFHSFCSRVLRQEAAFLEGYNDRFSIYDETDKKMVIKKILKSKELQEDDYLNYTANHISHCKNRNLTIEDYCTVNSALENIEKLQEIMLEYEKIMRESNAMDFDDLLLKALWLLQNKREVSEKYQHKFKYILADEFQDTNRVQYELIKILSAGHGNVFAVGDEDQSIYSWRGASIDNIKKFLNDFPNATLYKLEQNYRSTKNILDIANKIIKHNENRIDKTLFTENDTGVRVEYVNKFQDREEAEYVVQQIYTLTRNYGYNYNDIAVLMRLNALTRSFEERLLSYNIPYRVFGGLKFYERAEIKNVLAYLKLIVNPRDEESFQRIINFPKRSIGAVALSKLKEISDGRSMFESVMELSDFSDKTLSKFQGFKLLMEDLKEKADTLPVSELTEHLIKTLNLQQVYDTEKVEDESRMSNLSELIASMQEFERENQGSLLDYLQNVSLTTDLDTYSSEEKTVTLATVHSAKGLEFKVVFVIGLEERYFPIIREDTDDNSIEEERRLMYVAVTRAKERLYLTNAGNRYMYGRSNYTTPSRFLKEIDLIKEKTVSQQNDNFSQENTEHQPRENTSPYASRQKSNDQYVKGTFSQYSSGTVRTTVRHSSLKTNDNIEDLRVGSKVEHTKFGVGTVKEYDKNNDYLVVNFDGFGNKILSPKFAPIKTVK